MGARLLNRRRFVGGLLGSAAILATDRAFAVALSDVRNLSHIAGAELAAIFSQADALGIPVPDLSRSTSALSRIDLAGVILAALDKSAADSRAFAVAKRGGIFLSSLNQIDRDLLGREPSLRLPPPPFDVGEKAALKSMFQQSKVGDAHKSEIAKAVALMTLSAAKSRYDEVAVLTEVPWYVIAALHYREANLNFFGHLHNGDRLDRKTKHVPPGRPRGNWPPSPFEPRSAWRNSAVDALTEFAAIKRWSVEQMLFGFEKYNGFGYRPHNVHSPYVWNYSQFYNGGGFPRDRVWSDGYVSKQAGLGMVIKAISAVAPSDLTLDFES